MGQLEPVAGLGAAEGSGGPVVGTKLLGSALRSCSANSCVCLHFRAGDGDDCCLRGRHPPGAGEYWGLQLQLISRWGKGQLCFWKFCSVLLQSTSTVPWAGGRGSEAGGAAAQS